MLGCAAANPHFAGDTVAVPCGRPVCMAAGGRNPQKSAAARAKKEAQRASEGAGGGGAAGKAARGGDADVVANAFEAAKRERELKHAEKAKKEADKKRKEEAAKRKLEKEAKALAKAAGGKSVAQTEEQKIAELQKKWMPTVKDGDNLEAAGDLEGALAKFQEAMTGFRTAGVKRPKLKEKMDGVKAK